MLTASNMLQFKVQFPWSMVLEAQLRAWRCVLLLCSALRGFCSDVEATTLVRACCYGVGRSAHMGIFVCRRRRRRPAAYFPGNAPIFM